MQLTDNCHICEGRGQVIHHYDEMSRWEVCHFCDGSGQIKELDENKKQQLIYIFHNLAINQTEREVGE